MSIIIVINVDVNVPNDDENEDGNDESTESISLAKRFIILPIGVVSKKDVGACNTPANINACNFLLAA
jgi:hypothetical protein